MDESVHANNLHRFKKAAYLTNKHKNLLIANKENLLAINMFLCLLVIFMRQFKFNLYELCMLKKLCTTKINC